MIIHLHFLMLGWLLAGLAPTDPNLVPDDFLSISCPDEDACYLLEASGELFASADGGLTLQARSQLESLAPKVLFTGTLHGWMISRGRLWRSRDGGRRFEALAQPDGRAIVDICLDEAGRLVLATADGWLYRHVEDARFRQEGPKISGGIRKLSMASDGSRLAIANDGSLFVRRPGDKAWGRSQPLPRGVLGAAWLQKGVLVATGCKRQVRISTDIGKTWQTVNVAAARAEKTSAQPGPGVCLWPARQEAWGHALLLGAPGKLGLLSEQGTLRWIDTGHKRIWRAAARHGHEILLVGDGGARGVLQRRGQEFVFKAVAKVGAAFVAVGTLGKKKAYRANAEGLLEWSIDGGLSWTPSTAPLDCRQLQFVDAKRGFALAGTGQLHGTVDGGKSWKELVRWDGLFMKDMYFLDSRYGWVVGGSGAVARTKDGGVNWTLDRADFSRDFLAVRFFDRRRGWAVGEKQAVFSSVDGGRTWSRKLRGRGSLRALVLLGSKQVFVAGDQGLVMETQDAGKTWQPRSAPTDRALMGMVFVDDLRGMVVGSEGRAYVTADGAETWHRLRGLATRARFTRAACFAGSSLCLLGAERGWMLAGNPFQQEKP